MHYSTPWWNYALMEGDIYLCFFPIPDVFCGLRAPVWFFFLINLQDVNESWIPSIADDDSTLSTIPLSRFTGSLRYGLVLINGAFLI